MGYCSHCGGTGLGSPYARRNYVTIHVARIDLRYLIDGTNEALLDNSSDEMVVVVRREDPSPAATVVYLVPRFRANYATPTPGQEGPQ